MDIDITTVFLNLAFYLFSSHIIIINEPIQFLKFPFFEMTLATYFHLAESVPKNLIKKPLKFVFQFRRRRSRGMVVPPLSSLQLLMTT